MGGGVVGFDGDPFFGEAFDVAAGVQGFFVVGNNSLIGKPLV